MTRFSVERNDELVLHRSRPLSSFYVLSPCVWKEAGRYQLLLRAVNPSEIAAEKVARIYHGVGRSATEFDLDRSPAIAPGPNEDDRDGCEDATLASRDGIYYVYYSGWNQSKMVGQLLLATGRDIHHLQKRGRVFNDAARFHNAKEATIVCAADRTWRLFFEFAEDDRSKIGIASAPSLDGPWKFEEPLLQARQHGWDGWHLSTGPVSIADPQRPLMFYNGADREAHWRVGWVEFDACFTQVMDRGDGPIISPPPEPQNPEDTDIAFAASAVDEGECIGLYYSIADRLVMRALLRRSS